MSGECSTRPGGRRWQLAGTGAGAVDGGPGRLAVDRVRALLTEGFLDRGGVPDPKPGLYGMITVDRGHDAENTEDHKPRGQF